MSEKGQSMARCQVSVAANGYIVRVPRADVVSMFQTGDIASEDAACFVFAEMPGLLEFLRTRLIEPPSFAQS